jgi:hypothetical protein
VRNVISFENSQACRAKNRKRITNLLLHDHGRLREQQEAAEAGEDADVAP